MSALPPELALRVGMAARAVPGLTVTDMVHALIAMVGVPFTENRLAKLEVADLRKAGGVFALASRRDLREALAWLAGRRDVVIAETAPPKPTPILATRPGLKVAVASNHSEIMDGDFSTCQRYLIYRMDSAELDLIDVRNPAEGGRKSERDRLRADLLADCHLLCACNVGNLASARLMSIGIHPVQLTCKSDARSALKPIQEVLAGHPPPWLVRAMGTRNIATTAAPLLRLVSGSH